MRSKLKFSALCAAMFLVALTPAAVQALRGIFPSQGTKSFDDCKNSGYIQVDPTDNSSPTTIDEVDEDLIGAGGLVEGTYGRPETILDAGSYAETKPFVEFAKGSRAGNAIPGPGQLAPSMIAYPATLNTMETVSDTAEWNLEGTCQDCPHAKYTVILKQRLWKKTTITWTAATSNQKPQWSTAVESMDINRRRNILLSKSGLDPATGNIQMMVECKTNVVYDPATGQIVSGSGHTATINDGGTAGQTNSSGIWVGSAWNPNNSRSMTLEASWDNLDRDEFFSCDSHTAEDDIGVDLKYGLSIGDLNGPPVDVAVKNKLETHQEYGSLLLLWRILVTRNCDGTPDSCPCLKFMEANLQQPNTP